MSMSNGLRAVARSPSRGIRKSAGASQQLLSLLSKEGWPFPEDGVGMSRDRAMKISTVNRCVEVLSNSMAVLPIYIMNEATKERLPNHRLGKVLWGRANEAMTSYDYTRLLLNNEILRGNAYALIYRDRSSGDPVELIPLPPDYVDIFVDPSGKLWYVFTHPLTGLVTWLRPEDVLHYKAYSEDGIQGISILRRASTTLDTAQSAQLYENSVWRNGGQPSGVLTTDSDLGCMVPDPQDPTQTIRRKDLLRREWERIHRGPDNAFRLAVLDLGLKYQPISMTNADAQFVESNDVRVADVCRFFGVPLHLAFAGKQSYQSNEQNGIEYVTYTLLGYETQWGQEDSYKLLLPGERRGSLRIRRELEAVQNVLQNQYIQYQQSRESIELINRKYHDLKHQIAALRAEPDAERRSAWLDEMESDINTYEAQNKTGNQVLDVLLTGKSLYCQKHDIHLTTVADGTVLAGVSPMDLCTLVGNALDNAIESVKKIEDKEKRLIHVAVSRQKNFALLRFENCFEGELTFENGLPRTTKGNTDYHGYGLKSIRRTAQKYGGTVTVNTRKNWFELKILLPLAEGTQEK